MLGGGHVSRLYSLWRAAPCTSKPPFLPPCAAVELILADYPVRHVWVEGGATAAALIGRMNWRQFRVRQKLRPGVVSVQVVDAAHARMTMKPGSYTWPVDILKSHS